MDLFGKLCRFYWPLATNQVVMGFAHVLIAGALGRAPDSTLALAAYALASSLTRIAESPFLMSRQFGATYGATGAGLALAAKAVAVVLAPVLLVEAVIAWGPLKVPVIQGLLGGEVSVLDQAAAAFRIMMWIPALTAVRHLLQGYLARQQDTPAIFVGTGLRIALTVGLSFLLLAHGVPGAVIGALLVAAGIGTEALVAVCFAVRRLRRGARLLPTSDHVPKGGLRAALAFFLPLGLSALAASSLRSLIDIGLARAIDGPTALAGFSLAYMASLGLYTPLQAIHQMVIVFHTPGPVRRGVAWFTAGLAAIATLCLGALGWTEAGARLLVDWLGADAVIAPLAVGALRSIAPVPALVAVADYYAGLHLSRSQSGWVAGARMANVAVGALIMVVAMRGVAPLAAVQIAGTALTLGFAAEAGLNAWGWLKPTFRSPVRRS